MSDISSKDEIRDFRNLFAGHLAGRGNPSTIEVARDSGLSQSRVSAILNGSATTMNVETAVRLAAYMRLPVQDVLKLTGHGDVASLWSEVGPDRPDVYAIQLAQALDGLSDSEKALVTKTAMQMALSIKETKEPYIIGGSRDTTAKRNTS